MRVSHLAFLPLLSLSAQQYPNAAQLIEQNKRALKTLHSFQYVSESVIDMTVGGRPTKVETSMLVAAINPDKFRREMKSQIGGVMTIGADGEHTWIYLEGQKKYMKKDAIWRIQGMTAGFGTEFFTDKPDSPNGSKVIGEETIEVDGAPHDCWVVETKIDRMALVKQFGVEMRDVTYTVWLDKKSAIDWQMTMAGKMQGGPMPGAVEMRAKETKHGLKLDEDLPESLFTFTPPPDATEMAEADFPGMKSLNLAGQPAPAFAVTASDGRKYGEDAQKGKVVLLDFCGTAYAPCRNEIPVLNQLHREGKDRSLVVLGLDAGEDREAAAKLLRDAHVAYPTAAADPDIITAYGVLAYPTHVVIGRDGKIVGQQTGGGEEALRKLLARTEPNAPMVTEAEPAPATAIPRTAPTGDVQAYVPMLKPLEYVEPVVPDAMKQIPGMVQVLATLNATGRVTHAEALSGPQALRQPAIDAVMREKFHPVIRDGRPVAAYTSTTVVFMVKGKSLTEGLNPADEMEEASRRLSAIAQSLPRTSLEEVADLEQELRDGDEIQRLYTLTNLAKAALTARAIDKATDYANELLLTAPQHREDWNYGNAVHDGNMVLGLLAVRQGNIRTAAQYLLDAGATPGSPQLNSFGPDMSLAKALLEKGERDTVLEYFSRCRKFWKMGEQNLDAWSETVRSGGIPNLDFNSHMKM